MISLASGLPLLQIDNHRIAGYSREWLEQSIQNAAAQAGHEKWWFATDIVKSLFLYLRERFEATVITVNELFGKLRATLEVLGFHDIAARLEDQTPPLRVSLTEIATKATAGAYELDFFKVLAKTLQDVRTEVYADGLRDAVRVLCGTKRWNRRCDMLRQEIVNFLESQVSQEGTLKVHVC
jgi:hypothetical protein